MCKIVLVIILSYSLIGCKASGPIFRDEQLESDEAIVYVYWANTIKGSAGSIEINVDGKFIGKLRSNGYLFKRISPGEHTIGCKTYCMGTRKFTAEPMQAYYFNTDYVIKGALLGKVMMEQIPAGVALQTIVDCKYSSNLPRDYVPPLYPAAN